LKNEVISLIPALSTEITTVEKVIYTILALWILKERFEDQEDEWQMIARKAKNFLKSLGITKLEPIFKKII
jgi:hypothetical protein